MVAFTSTMLAQEKEPGAQTLGDVKPQQMTTYAPPTEQHAQQGNAQTYPFHKQNASAYLLSLRAAQKPDIRPDFGPYESLVREAEQSYEAVKELSPEKRAEIMLKVIDNLDKFKRYKKFNVPALLAWQGGELEPFQELEAIQSVQDEDVMPPLPEKAQLPPAVAALAQHGCLWLDAYVEYSKQASPEGYEYFHEACAAWILSAVAAGRIQIPGGSNGQHTALNIALASKPGERAKSTTAEAAVNVLRVAGLGWLLGADETTPQKLLADMSGKYPPSNFFQMSEERQVRWKQRLAMAGQRGWYYDELGAFFRAMSKPNGPMGEFRGLLLKLDSRLLFYSYATKIDGTQEIDGPYLALLGCTTFADFRTVAKAGSDDWNDGMLSRFIPVVPPPGPAPESPFAFETISVPSEISYGLQRMHEWLGYPIIDVVEENDDKGKGTHLAIQSVRERPEPREITPNAEVQTAWNNYRSALRTMEKPEDLASSYVRLPVKTLRVAALFAGIECRQVIELRHWAKAQEIAEHWRKSLHELYAQVNGSREPAINTLENKVLAYLEKHPRSKARDIYQNLNIDAEMAKKALFNLVQSGDITETTEQAANSRIVKYYGRVKRAA